MAKKQGIGVLLLVVAALLAWDGIYPVFGQEKAKEGAGLAIARAVVGTGVENREPVGVAEAFPATTEKVYCFLEAVNVPKDMEISVIWFHGQKEMRKIVLPLKTGLKWRTYAFKNLGGLKGDWKVEIQDPEGKSLKSLTFKVE